MNTSKWIIHVVTHSMIMECLIVLKKRKSLVHTTIGVLEYTTRNAMNFLVTYIYVTINSTSFIMVLAVIIKQVPFYPPFGDALIFFYNIFLLSHLCIQRIFYFLSVVECRHDDECRSESQPFCVGLTCVGMVLRNFKP